MMSGRFLKVALLASALTLGVSGDAFAGTVGTLLNNVTESWNGMPAFMSLIAYISGIVLAIISIYKFKDHVDNPHQTPISAAVKRLIAGGMFLSLPFMTNVTRGNLFGDMAAGGNSIVIGDADVGGVTSEALDGMAVRFIGDIYGPATGMLTAFCYLAAIAFLLVGISRLTKKMEEGPRGPAGMGTLMTFIASGALFSFADSMGTFVNSVFGSRDIALNVEISPEVLEDAADRARVEAVISALMGFIMLVGFIAFIRGWFVLKSFADGQQGATMAQGLTFLFGGTLAINLGELVNVIQATVGIDNALTFL